MLPYVLLTKAKGVGPNAVNTKNGSGRDNCLKLHDKDSKSWLV